MDPITINIHSEYDLIFSDHDNNNSDFVHRHVHDTVVILEEGNLPLPQCPRCDLQVSRKALNGRHLETNL